MPDTATLRVHQIPAPFAATAQAFLHSREGEYTLLISNLELLLKEGSAAGSFMASVLNRDKVVGVALYRELNLVLSHNATMALETLAGSLVQTQIEIPGVIGPPTESERFAETWSALRGCSSLLATDQGIYELTHVDWPQGIPGNMRAIRNDDTDLLTAWIYAFHREALPHIPYSLENARASAAAKLGKTMTYFWEMDGAPVAMGSLARPTTNGIAVNGVYTPPEHRNHGYATALVAALSNEGLRRGKQFCVLYTDLANPTSNSIYPKVGYRRIASSRNYRFTYA